jgi:hypothetical protein
MKQWIVVGTSMIVEAESYEDAVDRAQDSSGWHWEAILQQPGVPDRIRSSCGCGHEIVWTGDGWQHDVAPYFWGDDHDIDEPEPDPEHPARRYWDIEDGVRDE